MSEVGSSGSEQEAQRAALAREIEALQALRDEFRAELGHERDRLHTVARPRGQGRTVGRRRRASRVARPAGVLAVAAAVVLLGGM